MVRDGKPKGFFYLDHRTVDGLGIITDTYATPANVHDSIVYLDRLDRTRTRFKLDVKAVGLDAGYATTGIAKGLEDRDILGVTGYRRPTPPKPGMMRKKEFIYQNQLDGYRCSNGQFLTYSTTDRNGYRHYKSDPKVCKTCPFLRPANKIPNPNASSHAMFGPINVNGLTSIVSPQGAKPSISGVRKRWSVPLQMPSSSLEHFPAR